MTDTDFMTNSINPDNINYVNSEEEIPLLSQREITSFNKIDLYQSKEGIVPLTTRQLRQNRDSVVSFVCSLSVMVIFWILPFGNIALSVIGIVFGHKFLKETANTPHIKRGLATAGLVCGYIALPLSVFMSIYFLTTYMAK